MNSNTKCKKKKKEKEANFLNNQLECLFFFLFSSKKNTFMTFPNQNSKHPKTQSKSQTSQNRQYSTSTSKL